MGIIYAIKSFFSGNQPNLNLNANKIRVSAMKLTHSIKLRQSNLKKQAQKRQQQYIQMINGPTHFRSMSTQRVYLDDQVMNSYRFTALQQIIHLAQIIKAQANILQQNSTKMSNQCFKAVCSIVYCYKQLQLDQMIQLSDFIPQPYPSISASKLTPPLQEFVKKKKPIYYQINLYILEMMQRNTSITLQRINASGFQFQLNPIDPAKESSSSMMFAMEQISEQEMQMPQSQMQPKLGQFNNEVTNYYQSNNNNQNKNSQWTLKNENNSYGQKSGENNDDDDFAC